MFKLKPSLIAEPLVNSWHAWCHLVSPITLAMTTTNLHIPIMQSYLKMPHEHVKAAKNPDLRGGSFLNLSEHNALEQVAELLQSTQNSLADLILVDNSLRDFNKLLLRENTGGSLENFYQQIPSFLKGYIELVYDLNNTPQLRLIEPLLYKSSFYKPTLQSYIFSEIDVDERPFGLSTPRFQTTYSTNIQKSFNDVFYDDLFKTKNSNIPFLKIKEMYSQHLDGVVSFEKFINFFEPASQNSTYEKENLSEIKYFGHACVYINTGKVKILIDPFVSYDTDNFREIDRFSFKNLPSIIDYVLITHAHLDHASLETLIQIRHKIKNIIVPKNLKGAIQDPSLKLFLLACGFENIYEIDELDEINFEGGKITGIPFLGEHADLNIQSKIVYLLNFNNYNILFASDSNNIESKLYEHIASFTGKIDMIFLGMESEGAPLNWLYGSLLLSSISNIANKSRRLNGSNMKNAFNFVSAFKCKNVYIYAMGLEPWVSFISTLEYSPTLNQIIESDKFISMCQKENIVAERLYGKKHISL
jgi:L-ascorbate metabolism protein UlaG (beta-lactamase superfamily)